MKNISRSEEQRRQRQSQADQGITGGHVSQADRPCCEPVDGVTLGSMLGAMTLAHAVATDLKVNQAARTDLENAALVTGEWLVHQQRPGQWDTIDIEGVVRMMCAGDGPIRERFLFSLTTLIGWACVHQRFPAPLGRRYMHDIQRLSRRPATVKFAADTEATLAGAAN